MFLLLACVTAPDPDPTDDLCAHPDAISGTVAGSFEGDGQKLVLRSDYGGWSDDCYGGEIDAPHTATDGAFDWPAEFDVGAGAPEQRPIRAVGCAAGDWIDLSIVEEDGTPFWGPWRLERQDEDLAISTCD